MIDGSKSIIQQGRTMTCPSCNVQSSFGISVPETAVKEGEVILTCPSCKWQYKLDEVTSIGFVLPKRDPRLPLPSSTWLIEIVGKFTREERNRQWEDDLYRPDGGAGTVEINGSDPLHEAEALVSEIPKEVAAKTFPEMLKEVSGMVLSVEHHIEDMRRKLSFVKDALLADVEAERGMMAGVFKNIDVEEFYKFFDFPVFSIPIVTRDKALERYGRVILTPKFYRGNHGIQLGSSCGWRMQVVSPYSSMNNQLERWIHEKLDIPPVVSLYPTKRKIYGQSLPFVWSEIPGTEPSRDHQEDSPSIQFSGDGAAARQWLARHGCPAWPDVNIGGEMPSFMSMACEKHPRLRPAFKRFFQHGRILLSMDSRVDMYYVASVMASCFVNSGIYVTDDSDAIDKFSEKRYKDTHLIKPVTKCSWKLFSGSLSEMQKHKLIIVDADAPWFHEIVDSLYMYTDRLILLTSNPVFDMFQDNSWAPVVYGLVNCSAYYLPNTAKPYSWIMNSGTIGSNLAMALEKIGMFNTSG